jgi:hypothetical protein
MGVIGRVALTLVVLATAIAGTVLAADRAAPSGPRVTRAVVLVSTPHLAIGDST